MTTSLSSNAIGIKRKLIVINQNELSENIC